MVGRAAALGAMIAAIVALRIAHAQPATGSAEAEAPGAANGSAGADAAGAGSAGAGSGSDSANGSAGAGSGSDSATGSAGAGAANGSAGSGAGSASGAGAGSGAGSGVDKVIQLPIDIGAPTVRAAASPSVARLGGHFTLYITATYGAGVEVNLREPLDLGPVFEVRKKLSENMPAGGGRTTREWQIDVTPWELGDLKIAPIAVTFTVFGRAGQVQTNAVPVKIVGVLGEIVDDPKAMRGLAAPAGLTTRDWFWIWVAAAAGAVVGVIVAALWLRQRRRRRALRLVGGAIGRPRRIDMTGERALERLLAIEQSGVLDRDAERKTGYAEMVGVIRDYLAARYRFGVHDLTSSELLRRLEVLAPGEEIALVAGWLEGCDLVKYGGQRVTPAEAGKALDDARALIVTTTELQASTRQGTAREVRDTVKDAA